MPPWAYKLIWVAAFACNLYTVGLPGRFDGQAAQASQAAKAGGKTSNSKEFNAWKTVFQPAGWAFAIWGIIYLGETIGTLYVAAVGRPAEALKTALPYWVAGNLFQSLWCFAFRERFRRRLYLPASLLFLAGCSFAAAQRALTEAIKVPPTVTYRLTLTLTHSRRTCRFQPARRYTAAPQACC